MLLVKGNGCCELCCSVVGKQMMTINDLKSSCVCVVGDRASTQILAHFSTTRVESASPNNSMNNDYDRRTMGSSMANTAMGNAHQKLKFCPASIKDAKDARRKRRDLSSFRSLRISLQSNPVWKMKSTKAMSVHKY